MLDGKKSLDIFECARVDPHVPIEETVGVLAQLIREGKIRGIGLSEVRVDTIRRAAKVHKIAQVEVEVFFWSRDILSNGVGETCAERSSLPKELVSHPGSPVVGNRVRIKCNKEGLQKYCCHDEMLRRLYQV